MLISVISLFPEILSALDFGVVGRAKAQGKFKLNHIQPRDYASGNYQQIDDRPYGGGPGMVMMAEPLLKAIAAATALQTPAYVVNLSPQGELLTQAKVAELAQCQHLVLLAARYEGVDQRVIALAVDAEISVGDYVLSGGEIPALTLIDAIIRLLPGVLGDQDSLIAESFVDNLLDFPHYTRPEMVSGRRVPEVLLSGNHQAIERWRKMQALGRTALLRPDLLAKHRLTDEEKRLLKAFQAGEENVEDHSRN